jgi:site-specific DNA-methyltransferase (adenine-specific)
MDYELIHADCIQWMNAQPEQSIHCIVTSPPYNLDIKYGTYQDDLPRDSYLKWLRDVAIAAKRVLTNDGHLFLNVGYSNTDPWVAMDVAQVFRQEFVLQNNFTWVKHILVNGQSQGIYKPITSDRYASATTESIFHFTKDGNVKVDRLAIGHRNTTHEKYPELYSESRHIAEQRRKVCRKMGFKDWLAFQAAEKINPEIRAEFDQLMIEQEKKKPWDPNKKKCIGNAWFIGYTPVSKLAKQAGEEELGTRESGRGGHPATFPEQLPDMCIKFSGIAKGSRVYDPFNGTGTTVLAAIKNDMYGVGTDLDEDYLAFSRQRLTQYLTPEQPKEVDVKPKSKTKTIQLANPNLLEFDE